MLSLADGTLYPLTVTGRFTIARLRLNRSPLITYRPRATERAEYRRTLASLEETSALLGRLQQQLAGLLKQQRQILDEQRALINLLPGDTR